MEKKTTIGKNKEGYGYKYTDLAEIHNYLESHNMKYYQEIETAENGNDYILTYRFIDGEWEKEPKRGCKVVDATLSGIKNPAQEQGSALTYARRYSLLMAFGLATDDDDAQSLTMPIITSTEEAKAYKLTFGKYANKTLGEVPESYLNWLFENSKDETIKTACDYLIDHTTTEEVFVNQDLIQRVEELIIETNTDRERLLANYEVNDLNKMKKEQLENAIDILERKMNK